MKTSANVYLISTGQRVHDTYMIDSLEYHVDKKLSLNGIQYHLYITLPQSDLSASKFKEGDYIYLKTIGKNGQIGRYFYDKKSCTHDLVTSDDICYPFMFLNVFEKIIAATDSSLDLKIIPKSFIKHFVSKYNEGDAIKQVEIELETRYDNKSRGWQPFPDERSVNYLPKEKMEIIKISLKNEIYVIVPEEKLYTSKEVKKLCGKSFDAGQAYAQGSHKDFTQIHKNKEDFINSLDL